MSSFRITYSLFYIVGLIYTSFCIYKNVRQYLRHESDIVVTEYENGKIESKNHFLRIDRLFLSLILEGENHQVENSFPEIILCSDSMHSRTGVGIRTVRPSQKTFSPNRAEKVEYLARRLSARARLAR